VNIMAACQAKSLEEFAVRYLVDPINFRRYKDCGKRAIVVKVGGESDRIRSSSRKLAVASMPQQVMRSALSADA